MTLLDNIAKSLGYVKAPRGSGRTSMPMRVPEVSAAIAQNAAMQALTDPNGESYSQAYEVFSWVYFCVGQIAKSAALVDLDIYDTTQDEVVSIKDHPFIELLRKPNHMHSRFFLLESIFSYLLITGNAFIYVTKDRKTGMPIELWPLRPDRVSVVPSAKEYIKGYIYDVNGVQIPLDRSEVVHLRRFHPRDDFLGLSPIRVIANQLAGDQAAVKWNANFFGPDNAVPSGIVNIKTMVSDNDYDRLVDEWKRNYGGAGRKTAFLRGADVEWQSVTPSQVDMQFLEMRKWTREEVFQVFGMPLGKWSENATEANASIAEHTFLSDTLWPLLCMVAEELTAHLIKPNYGEQYILRFKDVRLQSRAEEIKELNIICQGMIGESGFPIPILTRDEIRQKYFHMGAYVETEDAGEMISDEDDMEAYGDESESPKNGNGEQPEKEGTEQEAHLLPRRRLKEMRQWRRKSINALRRGKSAAVAFSSDYIEPQRRLEIMSKLTYAQTIDDVNSIFGGDDGQTYP